MMINRSQVAPAFRLAEPDEEPDAYIDGVGVIARYGPLRSCSVTLRDLKAWERLRHSQAIYYFKRITLADGYLLKDKENPPA